MVELAVPPASRSGGSEKDGADHFHLVVDNVTCPSCIKRIEEGVTSLPGVLAARLNLSTKRLSVATEKDAVDVAEIQSFLAGKGFHAMPFDPRQAAAGQDRQARDLLWRMAVAGFATANVMLLSVSVWSGHDGSMGEATRALFHWVSALIAVPAVAYAGQPFFRSAVEAISAKRLNMDVPISLAVILAMAMSFYRTWAGEAHIYFDAGLMLVFFLLIGRYLDRRMRGQVTATAQNLLALRALSATVVGADGTRQTCPIEALRPGMTVAVAVGERIPVDGAVLDGRSEVDTSLITGESLPQGVGAGDPVYAGTVNLAGPLQVTVGAVDEDTVLSEIVRLMEAAEQRRSRYVALADRVAKIYAPVVHILAAATLLGWWGLSSIGFEASLMNAVAVLIITCPCALGLAVPVVQVIAVGRLLKRGILTKSGDGLERLASVDTVVFDKTGTLTTGQPKLLNPQALTGEAGAMAAALAAHSKHPLARALAQAADGRPVDLTAVEEVAGQGLSAVHDGTPLRLGRKAWCGVAEGEAPCVDHAGPEIWFKREGSAPIAFLFGEELRPDAREVVSRLKARGLQVLLLSGDRESAVAAVARDLGIGDWLAGQQPGQKIARIQALQAEGKKVVMVGDGLNDAPALAEATASLSPATAADISQTAADFVFQGANLAPVAEALETASRSRRLVVENFALAFGYNVIAVPLAVIGMVTPLIAAVAMSSSSILVIVNALRLARGRRHTANKVPEGTAPVAEPAAVK